MPALPDHDPLQTTLDSLRSDVERTPLADSLSVRRRGQQRARHQAVAGAVVVAALVAGVFGVADLRGDGRNGGIPATKGPTASTEVEKPLALAADPLFPTGSPLLSVGSVTFARSPEQPDISQTKLQCMPDPATLGAAATRSGFFYSDVEGTFSEHVLQFPTATAAAAAQSRLQAAFEDCPAGDPAEVAVADRGPEATGLDGFHASRTSTPTADAGINYNETGVVRDRNVLVVLYYNGMGNPAEAENATPAASWVWTAERLQAAIESATA